MQDVLYWLKKLGDGFALVLTAIVAGFVMLLAGASALAGVSVLVNSENIFQEFSSVLWLILSASLVLILMAMSLTQMMMRILSNSAIQVDTLRDIEAELVRQGKVQARPATPRPAAKVDGRA